MSITPQQKKCLDLWNQYWQETGQVNELTELFQDNHLGDNWDILFKKATITKYKRPRLRTMDPPPGFTHKGASPLKKSKK